MVTKNRLNQTATSKRASKQPPKPLAAPVFRRLVFVWSVLVIGAIALTCRLYYLQLTEIVPVAKDSELANQSSYLAQLAGKNLQQIALNQQTTSLELFSPRRQIVDRASQVLATDVITYRLYIHPHLFVRNQKPIPAEEVAGKLATILETRTKAEFLTYFKDKKNRGVPLAEKIPESAVRAIKALHIDGLDLRKQYSRAYPYREMTAEIVGYINEGEDRQPQAGVEYTQNSLLARQPIRLRMRRSYMKQGGKNKPVYFPGDLGEAETTIPFSDLRLQLTIDLRLQQAAKIALQTAMEKYEAKRGTVIVMDVNDGSIAAMVCDPTYDPNLYREYSDYSLFKNWAVTDLYEPGSTFKPINIAIAIDEGVVTPRDTFEDTGEIEVGTDLVRNHDFEDEGARGEVTIPKILQTSSNVGMIRIMDRLEPETYYQRLKELGIEDKLELEIPWSTAGRLKDRVEFIVRDIEPATAAFGQGFSLTPLKLIQLHAAIANGGKLVTPHVVKGLSDFEGYLHYSLPNQETRIFSEKTANTVLKMMETVVEEGSGQVSQIKNYRIAGKTGTSQKSDSTTGSYAENAKITSFVATFPVEKPRYTVLAVVDEPQGKYTYGSTVAAPVVKEVIDAIIAHEGIEPNEEYRPPSRHAKEQEKESN